MKEINKVGILIIAFSLVLIVMLSLIKVDVDAQASFLCEISHTTPGIDINECPAHQSSTSDYITASFGAAFLILAAGVYVTFSKPTIVEKKKFREFDLSKLEEDEKKIYDIVKNSQGSAYQSDIIKETGFTKVKTSRILDKLEQKGILERKRRGMTNIVVLR